jgi:hypothetical protein
MTSFTAVNQRCGGQAGPEASVEKTASARHGVRTASILDLLRQAGMATLLG